MQRLLYIIIFPIIWVTSRLPLRILYIKSTFLFLISYYIIGYRKKVIKENIQLVYPDKTEKERNLIAKKFYQHLCDLIFEAIKCLNISEEELLKRYKVTNIEIVERYYRENRSVLVLGGHYANWEWSGFLNRVMPYQAYGVYKKLDNTYFDRLVKKGREGFGAVAVLNKKIVQFLIDKSNQGEKTLTYLLSDQSPKANPNRPKDTFMGIEVPVFTGTEELAKKLDFAVLYLKTEKVKRGYYKNTFIELAEHPREFDDFEITRLFLNEIEKQIQENPNYYLWSHKRWKHRTRPTK